MDTWQGCSFTGIDTSDARVCVGAAQHLAYQQARQGDIRAELRSSGDFIDGIDLRRLASKDPKRLRSSVHAVLPYNASCSLPSSVLRCLRLVYGHHLMGLIIAQTMACGCRSVWLLSAESLYHAESILCWLQRPCPSMAHKDSSRITNDLVTR